VTAQAPTSQARTAAAAFAESFGRPPAGVWSAPGRVNLMGEHTDYNRGLCLPMALPRRTWVAAARRDDDLLRVRSLQVAEPVTIDLSEVGPGSPLGWGAYAAGVLWALRGAGHVVGGLDLLVDGRVPLGAGLSSSAALECATALAAVDVFGLDGLQGPAGLADLARLCARAENDIALAPTGGMDQSVALLGSEGHALLLDFWDDTSTQVPFDLAGADLTVLVMDTRAEHALVDGQYGNRRSECRAAAGALGVSSLRQATADAVERLADPLLRRRARHVVSEVSRVSTTVELLRHGDFRGLGEVFDASHASMRDDFEISCLELDLAVERSRAAGAWAARMTGGGFGGSAIAVVEAREADAVTAAVERAFSDAGLRSPSCFTARAEGAGRREL
jgi:galactokinase